MDERADSAPLRIDDEAWPGRVDTDETTVELSPGHALELWLR